MAYGAGTHNNFNFSFMGHPFSEFHGVPLTLVLPLIVALPVRICLSRTISVDHLCHGNPLCRYMICEIWKIYWKMSSKYWWSRFDKRGVGGAVFLDLHKAHDS